MLIVQLTYLPVTLIHETDQRWVWSHITPKIKFSIKDIFRKYDQISSLVTFTVDVANEKLNFSCQQRFLSLTKHFYSFDFKTEEYLQPGQTSMIELSCENN